MKDYDSCLVNNDEPIFNPRNQLVIVTQESFRTLKEGLTSGLKAAREVLIPTMIVCAGYGFLLGIFQSKSKSCCLKHTTYAATEGAFVGFMTPIVVPLLYLKHRLQ